jgi:hypothetical protein
MTKKQKKMSYDQPSLFDAIKELTNTNPANRVPSLDKEVQSALWMT